VLGGMQLMIESATLLSFHDQLPYEGGKWFRTCPIWAGILRIYQCLLTLKADIRSTISMQADQAYGPKTATQVAVSLGGEENALPSSIMGSLKSGYVGRAMMCCRARATPCLGQVK